MAEEIAVRYKIVDVTRIPSAEAGRIGKYDIIVTYQDAAGRMRVVTIPAEKWDGKSEEEKFAVLQEYIRANEAERRAFIGKEITV